MKYWLKYGIIFAAIGSLLYLLGFTYNKLIDSISNYIAYQPTTFILKPFFLFLSQFSIFYDYHLISRLTVLSILIVFYFIIGVIIGLLINKIRKDKKKPLLRYGILASTIGLLLSLYTMYYISQRLAELFWSIAISLIFFIQKLIPPPTTKLYFNIIYLD